MDHKFMWETILTSLAPSIGKASILSFFKDSIISRVENGEMVVAVPTQISCDFIRTRFDVKIYQAAREIDPSINNLIFEVKGILADQEHPNKVDLKLFRELEGGGKSARKAPNKQELILEEGMRSKMFNPDYTLHSFIPGQENRLAHAACMAVANKPGGIYNPLFLYGGTGRGKTHLLQGVGHELLRHHPGKNVVYMTSEKFMNEIVDAIGKKHTKTFKEKYRKVDCLIVDDIQFFGNKASTQQEFFHTFNELYDAGKQIVLSSDKAPNDLDGLEERLKSRFNMGMVVEVQLPDYETRLAILNSMCTEEQVLVDPEVLKFIAFNVKTNIRDLEGVLKNAIAEAQLMQTTPTIKSVAASIRRCCSETDFDSLNVDSGNKILIVRNSEDVIDIVAQYYKLTRSDLIGDDRRKEFMIPRQICMYLIREILEYSYETIGEAFSGRNHTTVLHACNKIISEMSADSRITRDINALKKEIGL